MAIRHVNLLDLEASGPGQTELNYLAIIIVMALIACGCAGFAFWKRSQINNLKIQVDALTTEVAQLNAASSSKNKKTADKDIVSQLHNPISWSTLFKKVADTIPSSIHASQLTGSLMSPRALVLIGNTQSAQSVFMLKNKLETIPDCSKVTVTNLTQTTFNIECSIR